MNRSQKRELRVGDLVKATKGARGSPWSGSTETVFYCAGAAFVVLGRVSPLSSFLLVLDPGGSVACLDEGWTTFAAR